MQTQKNSNEAISQIDAEILPYNEYGCLKGSLENIGVNYQINNKSGVVFYTGEGILKNNILYSHKNEKAIIKPE